MQTRYFENNNYPSTSETEFWEITTYRYSYIVRSGKLGREGEKQLQEFDKSEACDLAIEQVIQSQIDKGYVEVIAGESQQVSLPPATTIVELESKIPEISQEEPLKILTPDEQEAISEKTSGDRLRELACQSLDLTRLVANNPCTDTNLLAELATSQDYETRRRVVANPNTPTHTLLKLGIEFPIELLGNPMFSLLLLENPNFLSEIPIQTLRSLVTQAEASVHFWVEYASRESDQNLLLGLAMNPNLPSQALEKLIQSRFPAVVEAARLHVNWPSTVDGYSIAVNALREMALTYHNERFLQLSAHLGIIPDFIIQEWIRCDAQGDKAMEKPLKSIAGSLATSSTLLAQLAQSPTTSIRSQVAGNLNTPPKTLETLATDQSNFRVVVFEVARNPNTPAHTLAKLSHHADPAIYASVAKNFSTPIGVLENMLSRGICIEETLWNPNLPDSFLKKWFETDRKTNSIRRIGPLSDFKAPPEIIEKLAKHAFPSLITTHPNTPFHIIAEWARSGDRRAVANSPHATLELLTYLMDYPNYGETIQAVVDNKKSSFHLLVTNKYIERQEYQKMLAERVLGGNRAEGKYVVMDAEILELIAEGWQLPEQLLDQLAHHEKPVVRSFVAQLPDAPIALLEELALDKEESVRLEVAQNPATPTYLLELLAQDKEQKVRIALAQRVYPQPSLLAQLARDPEIKVLTLVAQCSSTPEKTLTELSRHRETYVRQCVAENSNTPESVLEHLVQDPSPDVRQSLVKNPKLSDNVLIQLLELDSAAKRYWTQNPIGIPAALTYHANSPSRWIQLLILFHYSTAPSVLAAKAGAVNWLERYAIAQNPNTPSAILKILANDGNRIVRATAENSFSKG
jgi:predicted DNA-binding WGR domain protein